MDVRRGAEALSTQASPAPPARPRVLVTGAGGLLGGRLAALLAAEFDVLAAVRRTAGPAGVAVRTLDLLDPPGLARALDAAACDAVVHAAALAEPERCERDPELARRVNVQAGAALARLVRARGARLLALSTDMVFDGRQGERTERDPPAPIQVYGRTKLDGERALLDAYPEAAVVRVCLVAGRGHGRRGSASEAVAWALRAGRRPRLFVDQRRTPVDAESVADLLARLLRGAGAGIYHCGGAEPVTRYELGRRVAALLGLDARRLEALTSGQAPQLGARPADVTLSCERARGELGWAPRALDDGIRDGRPAPPS